MSRGTAYYLIDGALLLGTPHHRWLLEQPELQRLYQDEGDMAANAGPLLLPSSTSVRAWTGTLAQGNPDAIFACNAFRSEAPLDMLLAHLKALRFLHTNGGRRYYFRYADGRAFASVWHTLTAEQRQATLGPIPAWHHYDAFGTECCAGPVQSDACTPPTALPLHLRPEQWHQVLEAGRLGERVNAAAALQVGPPPQGTRAQRYTWAAETDRWLKRLGVDALPVQVAATLVVWQTAGLVLRAEQFAAALRKAQVSGDLDGVLAFSQLATAPKMRLP
ncbi:DUF4123 domain-containing protein [Pseudomonas sp. R5(2019)]|uniref:DUF4123 domain-containing protein n=1 Tax=Pseudomonas sp. R5(2019) TaxID=2697566 RepID=UPI0014124207|nr:DUF4123 domain-containing protein [Pseudomonas sp. R5(2019)]NBA97761.1 DUF4123 domain-containing protein [Pseudomonas sp. R5(2019)]